MNTNNARVETLPYIKIRKKNQVPAITPELVHRSLGQVSPCYIGKTRLVNQYGNNERRCCVAENLVQIRTKPSAGHRTVRAGVCESVLYVVFSPTGCRGGVKIWDESPCCIFCFLLDCFTALDMEVIVYRV